MSDITKYTVHCVTADHTQRVRFVCEASSAYDAEAQARAAHGARTLVAAVVRADGLITTSDRPADFGPGSPGYHIYSEELPSVDRVPRAGDHIYVGYHDGGHPSCPDGLPGIATVQRVEESHGAHHVSVQEHPGVSYNWAYLGTRQASLREAYGTQYAGMEDD